MLDEGFVLFIRFNPKREARPSQTQQSAATFLAIHQCFNPKREARPSQTVRAKMGYPKVGKVSIPNGKPGPLRLSISCECQSWRFVSIPNGKPGPLRQEQAINDQGLSNCFNPKREARPSQTKPSDPTPNVGIWFQSQTGSQALSD